MTDPGAFKILGCWEVAARFGAHGERVGLWLRDAGVN
jgi:hypothetical protein